MRNIWDGREGRRGEEGHDVTSPSTMSFLLKVRNAGGSLKKKTVFKSSLGWNENQISGKIKDEVCLTLSHIGAHLPVGQLMKGRGKRDVKGQEKAFRAGEKQPLILLDPGICVKRRRFHGTGKEKDPMKHPLETTTGNPTFAALEDWQFKKRVHRSQGRNLKGRT